MLALIIGGSGSGKSEYAENLAVTLEPGQKVYIATMYPWDEESRKRIERHRKMRAEKHFDTLECFYHLKDGVEAYTSKTSEKHITTAFLDCMSNLVANEMYCGEGWENSGKSNGQTLAEHILSGIDELCAKFQHVILVSNDVFTDGVDYGEGMQEYLKNLALVNEKIAERANLVVEVVCGIALIHKKIETEESTIETIME